MKAFVAVCGAVIVACGGGSNPAPTPCDQVCQDQIAMRALRETMKLVFNRTVQGKPVGSQDLTTACPFGGNAHVTGTATSNAAQGASEVQLSYVLDHCAYMQQGDDPAQTYNVTITGTLSEGGTIAVQPSATTALNIQGDGVTMTGTVHDPPLAWTGTSCSVVLAQNGANLSGTICGRQTGLTL
jgi:hypothetical protein